VKPQMMDAVLPTLAPHVGPATLVISVAAGKTLATFEAAFGASTPIVRTIPNTPAAVGRGMTVGVANGSVGPTARATTEALLSAVGRYEWIADEGLMDAVTAVSGSGPAYVFHLVEALAAAGAARGLDPALSMRIARATVEGAGELLHDSHLDAATLRKNVTSPGGTTAAALAHLMDESTGFPPLLREAVAAATRRGKELAG
jgi:pyrroline-5-carboxylate reductase